jgi:hypothetical protein
MVARVDEAAFEEREVRLGIREPFSCLERYLGPRVRGRPFACQGGEGKAKEAYPERRLRFARVPGSWSYARELCLDQLQPQRTQLPCMPRTDSKHSDHWMPSSAGPRRFDLQPHNCSCSPHVLQVAVSLVRHASSPRSLSHESKQPSCHIGKCTSREQLVWP